MKKNLPPHAFLHHGYILTDEGTEADSNEQYIEAVGDKLEYFLLSLKNKKTATDKKLYEELVLAILSYPHVPQFKQFLSTWHFQRKNFDQFLKTTQEMIAAHPAYLFGSLNMASYYLEQEDYEKTRAALGEKLELRELAPQREIFHVTEFVSYYRLAGHYYIETDNIDKAIEVQEMLAEIDEDRAREISMAILKKGMDRMTAKMEFRKERTDSLAYQARGYNTEIQTESPPVFIHEEIRDLYTNDLSIPRERLTHILKLERDSLIKDLSEILKDAVRRFEYYEEKSNDGWKREEGEFVLHALAIMAELKAREGLESIFDLLRQGDELLDFFLSDFLTEDLWKVLYAITADDLEPVVDFVKEPGLYTYARGCAITVFTHVAYYQPDRKEEVATIFGHLLTFFWENRRDKSLLDPDFLDSILYAILEMGNHDLLPQVKSFFEEELVSSFDFSSFESYQEAFEEKYPPFSYPLFGDIFSFYDKAVNTWAYYTEDKAENQRPASPPTLPKPLSMSPPKTHLPGQVKKVGRNSPCPCGSGKKYKKCCLGK